MVEVQEKPLDDGVLLSMADLASMNVFAQLKIDDPALAEEIKTVMSGEIRRIEIELSMAMADLRESYQQIAQENVHDRHTGSTAH